MPPVGCPPPIMPMPPCCINRESVGPPGPAPRGIPSFPARACLAFANSAADSNPCAWSCECVCVYERENECVHSGFVGSMDERVSRRNIWQKLFTLTGVTLVSVRLEQQEVMLPSKIRVVSDLQNCRTAVFSRRLPCAAPRLLELPPVVHATPTHASNKSTRKHERRHTTWGRGGERYRKVRNTVSSQKGAIQARAPVFVNVRSEGYSSRNRKQQIS